MELKEFKERMYKAKHSYLYNGGEWENELGRWRKRHSCSTLAAAFENEGYLEPKKLKKIYAKLMGYKSGKPRGVDMSWSFRNQGGRFCALELLELYVIDNKLYKEL